MYTAQEPTHFQSMNNILFLVVSKAVIVPYEISGESGEMAYGALRIHLIFCLNVI